MFEGTDGFIFTPLEIHRTMKLAEEDGWVNEDIDEDTTVNLCPECK
jgi:hypothetical protein